MQSLRAVSKNYKCNVIDLANLTGAVVLAVCRSFLEPRKRQKIGIHGKLFTMMRVKLVMDTGYDEQCYLLFIYLYESLLPVHC